jgi:hypothetical protein
LHAHANAEEKRRGEKKKMKELLGFVANVSLS